MHAFVARFTLTLSGKRGLSKHASPYVVAPIIWVAAQNHGRMTGISLIEPLNFAAIISCANVVQLKCCVAPTHPLLREQGA